MAPWWSVRITLKPLSSADWMTWGDGWPYELGPTDMIAMPFWALEESLW
jgi:hypothetical protein